MDPYGRSRRSAAASPLSETGLEESMWQLGLGGVQFYPERPGEVDCAYYLRTGTCGYGARCRYNHPRDRGAVAGAGGPGETYPERVGQPVCQFFLRTGTCNYGAMCKYHHPREGHLSARSLNYHGYPSRPGEKECSYYLKTGQCKFGIACKFHHPQPSGTSMSPSAPTFYPTVLQSPSIPSPSQYGVTSWQVAQPPSVSGSYVPGSYNSMILSPAVVRFPGWGPYSPPVSPMVNINAQHTAGTGWLPGLTHQLSPSVPAYTGSYSSISPTAGPSSNISKEHMFPERPGQPECRFYMRTGDCKYGSSCKYHHPPQWSMPKSNCILSPMGLPLRSGAPACTFYSQHGYCKFGPTCKFDHPMGALSYSPSASSLTDMPVAPYPIRLSLGMLAPSSSMEFRGEFVAGSTRDSSSIRIQSSENISRGLVVSSSPKASVSVPQSYIQLSAHSPILSSGSSGMVRDSAS